jgi:hypothetical protein
MTRRLLAVLFTCGVAASGCDRVVFDHALGSAAGADGRGVDDGGAVQDECATAQDGDRCDDLDVCTPSSSCRAGHCVGGNAFDSCVVADSEADFGTVQGENGWSYGYWNASADPDGSYSSEDFVEMEYCQESTWRPPGRCDLSEDDPAFRWTMNLAWGLQHPETEPDLELPVRRWRSSASGPARISADHQVGGQHSDGTRALLLLDGDELWRNDAEGGDEAGTQAEIDVELRVGTLVDQLVHPIGDSADDMTYFRIAIEGR